MKWLIGCVMGALGTWSVQTVEANEALPPPFGLSWGDSPGALVAWAGRTRLDQIVKSPADRPRLKIHTFSSAEGTLPDHDASSLEARFLDGSLFEVSLHYTYPGRDPVFIRGQFAKLKKLLTRRHGAFKPGGRREVDRDGVAVESTAFRLEPAAHRYLLLVLTEVVDAKRRDSAARFSVVYHNRELLEEGGRQQIVPPPQEGVVLDQP